MDANKELLPYLKLKLELEHPDLEDCWHEGYFAAQLEAELEENPYDEQSKEADYWSQGWWAGFYEEPTLSPKPLTVVNEGTFTRVAVPQAANETNWISDDIKRWTKTVVKVAGLIAITVVAIEFLDLAS
jgi:hypothetical protein